MIPFPSGARSEAREKLVQALREYLSTDGWLTEAIDPSHLEGTPERVVKMYEEFFAGVGEDPQLVLNTVFRAENSEMVTVYDIPITSVCAHHILPFYGRCHVAYIPQDHIIGLSKIPRLVDILSRRPQVQENLTTQIADNLMGSRLAPRGVAVCIDAIHTCMSCRGIRAHGVTRTTALRGTFEQEPGTVTEFMNAIRRLEV